MGRGRGGMNSSFSSISFDADTAKRFKELAKEKNKTHTKLLDEFLDFYDEELRHDL